MPRQHELKFAHDDGHDDGASTHRLLMHARELTGPLAQSQNQYGQSEAVVHDGPDTELPPPPPVPAEPPVLGALQLPRTQRAVTPHELHVAPRSPHARVLVPDSHTPLSEQQPVQFEASHRVAGPQAMAPTASIVITRSLMTT